MKIFIITLLLLLATFPNIYSQDFWEKTTGPDTTIIWSLATNSSGDVFAGTSMDGVFRSTDNGDSWTNLGMMNHDIRLMAINSNDDVYVAKYDNGGLFRSTDNGNSWDSLGLPLYDQSIAINNSNGYIFVGTGALGIWRTTDDGANWDQKLFGLDCSGITSLAINSSGDIFAGTYIGGIYRSTDNGENWVQINEGLTINYVLSLAINSSGHIFTGTSGGGAFRSTNNGTNWVQINNGLFGQNGQGYYVFSLGINSNGDIFAGTAEGVFRSTNSGGNWIQINQGLTNLAIHSLAINSNGGVFAGTEAGIFRSVISANIKLYLQGPYAGGGVMTTTLNTNTLIPLNSNDAYSTAVYGYTASTVTSIPDSDIVDWVLVELRTGTASGTKVAARAAFLKSDGTIVDTNGVSPLQFTGLGDGNYYVVVRHRNHLAIMTASAIPLSSSSALYDFSTAQLQAYGTNSMVALVGGGFGLYAGDSNKDGQITALDFNTWNVNTKAGQTGYVADDMNLDGQVTALDFNFWNVNTKLGAVTNVP